MTTALQQALADLESEREERTFERYRRWAVEHALVDIENRLRSEGEAEAKVRGGAASPSPLRLVGPRVRGAIVVLLLDLALWALVILGVRAVWQSHG